MEIYRPEPGTRIKDLDTPCLLVDLDALEHNYRFIADAYGDGACRMRQHAKNIKSPGLARMQIETGGTMGGVCAAKVSEAEVMVDGGISDILITSEVPGRDKLARVCALARRADIKVVVDDPRNLRQLSELAAVHGVTVGVLIEVDTSMSRAGVRSAEDGVSLARLATELPGIAFRGVMSHQAIAGQPDKETRLIEGRKWIQVCLDVTKAVRDAGIPVDIVSTGESWTWDVALEMPGVTEVQGGSYALMGANYAYLDDDFRYAAKIMGTVISTPRPGVAIGDVGARALAGPALPVLEDLPQVRVDSYHEEHLVLRSDGEMPCKAGDTFLLRPGQQDIIVNRWDQLIAVRGDTVEAVWDIPARGCHS